MIYLFAGLINLILSAITLFIVLQVFFYIAGALYFFLGVVSVEDYPEHKRVSAPTSVNHEEEERIMELIEEKQKLEEYIYANRLDTLSGRRTNTNPKAFAKLRRYEEIKEELL